MTSTKEKLLEIYKSEYERLKAEQLQRITFRDVQIPFSIFLGIAPILSLAFDQDNTFGYHLLLVIPLICVSLGWAYVANDEKITTIGDYVRETLKIRFIIALKELELDSQEQLSEMPEKLEKSKELEELIFGWENFHKEDKYKAERKVTQFLVNLLTFVVSGEVALIVFLILKGWSNIPILIQLLVCFEATVLLVLGWWIYVYSDFWTNFRKIRSKWKRSFSRNKKLRGKQEG